MIKHVLVMAALCICVTLGSSAAQAQALPGQPDAEKGEELTQRLCSQCHVSDANAPQFQGSADVPTFTEIAKKQGQSADDIVAKIILPAHPMPSITLTRDEMRDIAAYILSLRGAN